MSDFNPYNLGWWEQTSITFGIFLGVVIYFVGWGLFIAAPIVLVYQTFFK